MSESGHYCQHYPKNNPDYQLVKILAQQLAGTSVLMYAEWRQSSAAIHSPDRHNSLICN